MMSIKKPDEGFCKTCGKIMSFRSIQFGYRHYLINLVK